MATYHTGYDIFTPDPGACGSMQCQACGANMDVKRNAYGPRSFASAVSGHRVVYDEFTCPNAGKPWHDKVIKMREERRNTVVAAFQETIDAEIAMVLFEHRSEVR